MKKKIVTLALVAALVAVAVVGATLAYFTDTKEATNTFTVGNVQIVQHEKTRTGADFVQNQVLMPIVGSAQGADTDPKDGWSDHAENYVDKVVTVQNTGASSAYVRTFVAIPVCKYPGQDPANASENVIHWNFGVMEVGGVWTATCDVDGEWNWGKSLTADQYPSVLADWNYLDVVIGGVKYEVYCVTYEKALASGATTSALTKGLYLDKNVDFNGTNYTVKRGTEVKIIEGLTPTVQMLVATQAVQADGFTDPFVALDTAFGAFTEANNPFVTP